MLPFSNRLPKPEMSEVMRYGQRVVSEDLLLQYKKTEGLSRFAFVVSTKIDKRATRRNRIRRVLSESVRHMFGNLRSIDAVLRVRRDISGLPQVEVQSIVKDLFRSAGLLK